MMPADHVDAPHDRTAAEPRGNARLPQARAAAAQQRRALHLAVSDACNNSCVFCLNSRVDGRVGDAKPLPPSWEEIRTAIEDGYRRLGLREIIFTIAEPTIGKHVVDAVRWASELGYERIGMNTNGRRLGEGDLLDRLLAAGLNSIMLSVHGHDPGVHDRLVGRSGAFAQVVAGLERLASCRPAHGFSLQMLTVLTRHNLPHVEAIYRFFLRHARPERGDQLSFTALKMLGLGATRFDELGLRYQPLVSEWLSVWRGLGAPREMLLSEVPWCVVAAEALDGRPIPPIDIPDRRFVTDAEEGARASGQVLEPQLRGTDYTKRAECSACLLGPSCNGVLRGYAERFGWDEFVPVRELPSAAARSQRGRGAPPLSHGPLPARQQELVQDLVGLDEAKMRELGISARGLGEERGELWFALRIPREEAHGSTLMIYVGEPDAERPAFASTRELRIYYQSSDGPEEPPAGSDGTQARASSHAARQATADLGVRLVRRVARVLANARLDDLRKAWRSALRPGSAHHPSASRQRSAEPTGRPDAPSATMASLRNSEPPQQGAGAHADPGTGRGGVDLGSSDPDAGPLFGDALLASRLADTACGMMGAVEVLAELPGDFAVVVHGDRGCLPAQESAQRRLYTTDLGDMHIVQGAEDRMHDVVRSVLAERPAQAVVIVGTCLSQMIGEDLPELAREVEQTHGVVAVALQVSGLEALRPVEVADRVYGALGRRFLSRDLAEAGGAPLRNGGSPVALIGYPSRGRRFDHELGELAAEAGLLLGPRFPQGGIDALRSLAEAPSVLAAERVSCRSLLQELDRLRPGVVREQPVPLGLGLSGAFFRALASAADAPDRPRPGPIAKHMDALLEPRERAARDRIERFRARHGGRRVCCVFGGTHKGASLDASTHLGLAHVPLLVELGLDVHLLALSPEGASLAAPLEALAQRLGANRRTATYPRPERLPELLRGGGYDLAVVEDCHKHFVDAAAVAYLGFRQVELGFVGLSLAIDTLEILLS